MSHPQLILVGSVTTLAASKQRAADLYESQWFRAARAYAEATGESWAILSAAHGLLDPQEIVAPYELAFAGAPREVQQRWAYRVFRQIELWQPRRVAQVHLIAGRAFCAALQPVLEAAGYVCRAPMHGLGIGRQLQWLKQQTAELQRRIVPPEMHAALDACAGCDEHVADCVCDERRRMDDDEHGPECNCIDCRTRWAAMDA
jgi:hypothetical protein